MTKPIYEQVWACPMESNDAKVTTVGAYMLALARAVWVEGEEFSGKRAFGNSGWYEPVYEALVDAGFATDADSADKLVVKTLDHFLAGASLVLRVVDDVDLPASLQGRALPSWWEDEENLDYCCPYCNGASCEMCE